MINRIFVYGTLKKGQPNYELIRQYVTDVHPARTQGVLYDLGSFPAMTHGVGWVTGEVLTFLNEKKVLELLDELEGFIESKHPRNLYEREILWANYPDGQDEQVYCYCWAKDIESLSRFICLPDGQWRSIKD